jgi:ribosomal protein L11 methyltransferase
MLLRPAARTLAARLWAGRAGLAVAGPTGRLSTCPRMPPPPPLATTDAAAAAASTSSSTPAPDVLTATARAVPGPAADALADALLAYGALSAAVEEDRAGAPGGRETPLFGPDRSGGRVWPACAVTAVFPLDTDVEAATAVATAAAGIGAPLAWATAASAAADWQASLHGDFQPVRVNEGDSGSGSGGGRGGVPLWIIPAWCEVPPEADGAVGVRLTPGLAFGTGDHPTTRACLRWLAGGVGEEGGEEGSSRPLPPSSSSPLPGLVGGRVLDYGAGSGVLAVAALALGAARATATDVDALAVRAASENAALNGVAERLRSLLVVGDGGDGDAAAVGLPGGAKYDVVVANILQGPLLALAPLLAAAVAPGGCLAAAGILRAQAPPLVAALEAGGVEGLRVHDAEEGGGKDEGGWVLVTGRKRV